MFVNNCCDKCHRNDCDGCCGKCPVARYDCFFSIAPSPYSESEWVVTWNGMPHRVRIPKISETDTFLSVNPEKATLNYKAERHTDEIRGAQLGDIINLDDLRDVDIDDGLDGHCYEFIFHKWENCGDGCKSLADRWQNFNINSEGAKKNGIRYIRGANAYGCPVYLDIPTDETTYWWGMWRPNDTGTGVEFGYIKPTEVDALPQNEDGATMVLSQDSNGKPIYGPVKVNAEYLWGDSICSDFVPAAGFEIAEEGGNSICYYPRLGVVKISLDIWCSSGRAADTYFNFVVATIRDPRLWPSGVFDLPLHWVWSNNSNGEITPTALRINASGQVLLSGYVPARGSSGKSRYMILGVDDMNAWSLRS